MKQKIIIILALIVLGMVGVFAQGFVNLDFEGANLSGDSAGSVPATDALPGWTAYLGGVVVANINYNVSTSPTVGNQVDILGSSSGSTIQGNYYIYLAGTANGQASIGQTGTIPAMAQELIFWGQFPSSDEFTPGALSFNGQSLLVSQIGIGSNYFIYEANISGFAGQTGQLLFTSSFILGAGGDKIDNIQFLLAPEPSTSCLILLGSGVLLYARRKYLHL